MRCERAQQLYDEYTGGCLTVSTMGRVEEHLAGCPACREFFDTNDQLAKLLRQQGEVAHPGADYFENLNSRVLARLSQPEAAVVEEIRPEKYAAPRAWRQSLWWTGGLSAAALLALIMMPQHEAGLLGGANQAGQELRPRQVAAAQADPAQVSSGQLVAALQSSSRLGDPLAVPVNPGAPLAGAPAMEIKESIEAGRKELLLGPTISLAPDNPAGSAATPNGPEPTGTAQNRSMDKGIAGIARNDATVEDAIGSLARPQLELAAESLAKPLTPTEQKINRETEIKMVSLRKQAEQQGAMPQEIFDKLQAIKAQMSAGGDAALTRSLRDLDEAVRRRMGDHSNLSAMPIVRQAGLYLKAEDALLAGRAMDACTALRQITVIDDSSNLAMRARLQLADLFYSEWADFKQAESHYTRCRGAQATEALTSAEREHVERQLDRLLTYRANNWEALHLLHIVRRSNWNEVSPALRRLTALSDANALLPEAARTITERLNASPRLGADVTLDIYTTLANHAKDEKNPDVRAWLYLALGDMAFAQYQDSHQAVEHYRHVVTASENSGAAQLARVKLQDLNDRILYESIR